MRKLFYISALLILPAIVFAQTVSKQEVRTNHINKCKKELKEKMANSGLSDADMQSFCECTADKLLAKFTAEEVKKMEDIMANGTLQQKQETNEKVQPVLMPCFADLQAKMK